MPPRCGIDSKNLVAIAKNYTDPLADVKVLI
jgi:hypothetical protein